MGLSAWQSFASWMKTHKLIHDAPNAPPSSPTPTSPIRRARATDIRRNHPAGSLRPCRGAVSGEVEDRVVRDRPPAVAAGSRRGVTSRHAPACPPLIERTAAKMILLVKGNRAMGSPRQEGLELPQPAGGLFQRGFCGTTVATTRRPVRQTRPPRRPRSQCAVSATLSGIDRVAAEVAPNWLIGTPQPDRGRSTTEPHNRQGVSSCWEACGLAVQLVNAAQAKNLPGRPKTDKLDAMWLARLTEMGLLRASFVPPKAIRRPAGLHPGADPADPGADPLLPAAGKAAGRRADQGLIAWPAS